MATRLQERGRHALGYNGARAASRPGPLVAPATSPQRRASFMRPMTSHPVFLTIVAALLVLPLEVAASGSGVLRTSTPDSLPPTGCGSCHTGGTVPEVQILAGDGEGVAR